MIVEYDKSFTKCLNKIKNQKTKNKIIDSIQKVKLAETLQEIPSIKKIKGFNSYYRYRFGTNRTGFELHNDNRITLIVVIKRSDIYKTFP